MNKGSIYIQVVFMSIIIGSLLALSLSQMSKNTNVITSYMETDNLYNIALDAQDIAIEYLNRELEQSNALKNISNSFDFNNYYVIEDVSNKYNGKFNVRDRFFEKYTEEFIRNFDDVEYEYNIEDIKDYEISTDIYEEDNKLYIETTALSEDKQQHTIKTLVSIEGSGYIIPQTDYTNIPYYLEQGIHVVDSIDDTSLNYSQGNINFNSSILNNIDADINAYNPIVITSGNINLSNYKMPTILILQGDSSVIASDAFEGLIYCNGQLSINSPLQMSGTIIAKSLITNNNLQLNNNPDVILDIVTTDTESYRKILDFFDLTDFYNTISQHNPMESIKITGYKSLYLDCDFQIEEFIQ